MLTLPLVLNITVYLHCTIQCRIKPCATHPQLCVSTTGSLVPQGHLLFMACLPLDPHRHIGTDRSHLETSSCSTHNLGMGMARDSQHHKPQCSNGRMAGRSQKTSNQNYQVLYHTSTVSHIDAGLLFCCESPMLQCLIRGIKGTWGSTEITKLPITRDVLAHILASATIRILAAGLILKPHDYSISGSLRCGEFTTHSAEFRPSIHLTRSSMEFVPSIIGHPTWSSPCGFKD